LRVLLVEDDAGDAFLVRELLAEADAPLELTTAETMAAARPKLRDVHCVLLDLGLPPAASPGCDRSCNRQPASLSAY
jgi:DNA-binding response OmpR family regulator